MPEEGEREGRELEGKGEDREQREERKEREEGGRGGNDDEDGEGERRREIEENRLA